MVGSMDHALILIHDNRQADPDRSGPFLHWILGCSDRPDPLYDQTVQPDADRLELCGEASLATCFSQRGRPTTPHEVAENIRAAGGEQSVHNGTTDATLEAACARFGFQTAPLGFDQLPATIRHGGVTTCANPWGGRWMAYSDAPLGGAFVEAFQITGGTVPPPVDDGATLVVIA